MTQGILLLWWFGLLRLAWNSKDIFLIFFVLAQFVFIGLGLVAFSIVPYEYLEGVFSAFAFHSITDEDFNYAGFVTLLGVTAALAVSLAMRASRPAGATQPLGGANLSPVRPIQFWALTAAIVVVGLYYVIEHFGSFLSLTSMIQGEDLAEVVELRVGATSNYLTTLVVYNACPAAAIIAVAWQGERKRTPLQNIAVLVVVVIAIMALILTFQKRPLIVFLFALFVVYKMRSDLYSGSARPVQDVMRFLLNSPLQLVGLFAVLFILYYIYTAYRFSGEGVLAILENILEVMFTRVIGRLSIPAAFYVDYFPGAAPHYWFDNVGMLAALLDRVPYADTVAVFSSYSLIRVDGSVAASVFTDAYGQGGVAWVPVVGAIVGAILVWMRRQLSRTPPGSGRLLFFVFGVMFIYYLSQASLFRSMLGYGGLIWLAMWLAVSRRVKWHVTR